MRVIKNIHNNISLCLDSKGNEVIAFGKGIGFRKPPYDIPVSQIERTFYNANPILVDTLSQIPEAIIQVSTDIIDYANQLLNGKFNDNLIFTLADHIMFSMKRQKEHININQMCIRDSTYANKGDWKGISMMMWLGNGLHFLAYFIPTFLGLYFGAEYVTNIMNSIPANIMAGISAVGALLPALGFGLLLNNLSTKEYMGYFFIGFAMVAYIPAFGVMRCV